MSLPISFLAGIGGAVYPLDLSGSLPIFAYSIKKLTSSYNGPALRVVRPSDSATQDIGFAGQNIDSSALTAFLGSQTGKIDILYDQSGNGNNATQTLDASRPLISNLSVNGAKEMNFATCKMLLPNTVSISRQSANIFAVTENYGSNFSSAFIQLGSGTDQVSTYEGAVTNGIGYIRINNGPGNSPFPPTISMSLYEGILSPTSTSISQNEEITSGGASTAVTMIGGQIGNTSLSAGFDGKHHAGAFIGYNRVLSTVERSKLKTALNSLFGIPASVTRTVIYEGDSITIGSSPTNLYYNSYARQSSKVLNFPARIFNIAGGGNQLQNELPFYPNQAHLILARYSTNNRIVFLHIGTNDLTLGNRTDVQIYGDIQTYANNVKADGGKIIVSTLLPNSSWDAAHQSTRNSLNNLIRTNWPSFADGFADFAADPTMGPQSAASNTNLYADGLHPTEFGHSILAPIAVTAINTIL